MNKGCMTIIIKVANPGDLRPDPLTATSSQPQGRQESGVGSAPEFLPPEGHGETQGGWVDALEGIDQALFFPSIHLLWGDVRDPKVAAETCRAYNNWMSDFCKADPDRLFGMGIVPLQDIDASCEEVSRAARNGHLGVQIGNQNGWFVKGVHGLVTKGCSVPPIHQRFNR